MGGGGSIYTELSGPFSRSAFLSDRSPIVALFCHSVTESVLLSNLLILLNSRLQPLQRACNLFLCNPSSKAVWFSLRKSMQVQLSMLLKSFVKIMKPKFNIRWPSCPNAVMGGGGVIRAMPKRKRFFFLLMSSLRIISLRAYVRLFFTVAIDIINQAPLLVM